MAYNSQFTGAQIDEAIADVRSNKDAWNGKQDVILASGASVGDLIKVKAVDASGKPTAWAVAVAGTDYASPVFMRKVTLTVASWNSSTKQQSVAVSGVLSDGTKQKVICSPVDESYDSAWNTCYVQCAGHGADSLTFQCEEIPTVAVEVFVSIQSVSFVS